MEKEQLDKLMLEATRFCRIAEMTENKLTHQRVRLQVIDPDAGYVRGIEPSGGWPVVEGHIVGTVPGLYGKIWYLMELDRPLDPRFDRTSMLPKGFAGEGVDYLLLSPAPNMPTAEEPPDYIGECIVHGVTAMVLASAGKAPQEMPDAITLKNDHLFPGICSGELSAA